MNASMLAYTRIPSGRAWRRRLIVRVGGPYDGRPAIRRRGRGSLLGTRSSALSGLVVARAAKQSCSRVAQGTGHVDAFPKLDDSVLGHRDEILTGLAQLVPPEALVDGRDPR